MTDLIDLTLEEGNMDLEIIDLTLDEETTEIEIIDLTLDEVIKENEVIDLTLEDETEEGLMDVASVDGHYIPTLYSSKILAEIIFMKMKEEIGDFPSFSNWYKNKLQWWYENNRNDYDWYF